MKNNKNLEMIFIDELIANFIKSVYEYRDETSTTYNNFNTLIQSAGLSIWWATERGVSFETYLNLSYTLADIASLELSENFDDFLHEILEESLKYKADRG